MGQHTPHLTTTYPITSWPWWMVCQMQRATSLAYQASPKLASVVRHEVELLILPRHPQDDRHPVPYHITRRPCCRAAQTHSMQGHVPTCTQSQHHNC